MKVVHSQNFRVRFCECDAYGHLNNINYLRWMEEAAFGASVAVGYDLSYYNQSSRLWLIRETNIEYLTAQIYNDEVQVKTWVRDFRRSHSLRMYEFINARTGQLVARASTDWVYLDAQTMLPVTIPPEMQRAFCPDLPEEASARERFPSLPALPPNVFTMRRRVGWRDIDMMWHVNNAMYLLYAEDAGLQVCDAYGWPMQRMVDEGFAMFARQHRLEYCLPAQLGDELEIATWSSDARRAGALRHYTIHRVKDDALLARISSRWVWIDLKSGHPIRIPERMVADFADNLSPDTFQ